MGPDATDQREPGLSRPVAVILPFNVRGYWGVGDSVSCDVSAQRRCLADFCRSNELSQEVLDRD